MDTETNIAFVLRAASFAATKHRDQRRKDAAASPYINHPLALAAILANEGGVNDPIILAAALLHDTVEDTDTTTQELGAAFGDSVAAIVAEVTEDKSLDKAERKRLQVVEAATKSSGAKLVKLADKISNLRDIADCPPADWSDERRRQYAAWAMEVVARLRGVHPRLEMLFDDIARKLRPKVSDAQQLVMAKVFDLQAEQASDLAERAYKRTLAAELRHRSLRGPMPTLTELLSKDPETENTENDLTVNHGNVLLPIIEGRTVFDERSARLSESYRRAVKGTEWEKTYANALAAAKEDAGAPDWLTLLEIEGRGVARVWHENGTGRAWVWNRGRWGVAPGLLTKDGYRLGRYQFKREFPGANGDALFKLIREFLGEEQFASLQDPPLDTRLVRDRSMMDAGYDATLRGLVAGPRDFPTVLQAVLRDFAWTYSDVRPYISRWYLHAVEDREPLPNSTSQPTVDAFLVCLDAILANVPPAEKSYIETGDDDVWTGFLWNGLKAVSRFADLEYARIARAVRHVLRRERATGVFGDGKHRHQWDEYVTYANYGPSELDHPFEELVRPAIRWRIGLLTKETAVLLTIAQQWDSDQLEAQDGSRLSEDDILIGAERALNKLALDCNPR